MHILAAATTTSCWSLDLACCVSPGSEILEAPKTITNTNESSLMKGCAGLDDPVVSVHSIYLPYAQGVSLVLETWRGHHAN